MFKFVMWFDMKSDNLLTKQLYWAEIKNQFISETEHSVVKYFSGTELYGW